jgi:hypothetical protein
MHKKGAHRPPAGVSCSIGPAGGDCTHKRLLLIFVKLFATASWAQLAITIRAQYIHVPEVYYLELG